MRALRPGRSCRGVVRVVLGTEDIPEIATTSPTAPGVTRRWTNMTAFTEEVSNARIWAGFHYRFSTRVGTEVRRESGDRPPEIAVEFAVANDLRRTTGGGTDGSGCSCENSGPGAMRFSQAGDDARAMQN